MLLTSRSAVCIGIMKVLSNSSCQCAGGRLPSTSVKYQRSVHPLVRMLCEAALPLRFTTAPILKLLDFLPARKTSSHFQVLPQELWGYTNGW